MLNANEEITKTLMKNKLYMNVFRNIKMMLAQIFNFTDIDKKKNILNHCFKKIASQFIFHVVALNWATRVGEFGRICSCTKTQRSWIGMLP